MTTAEFKKVARFLKLLYAELDREALKIGVPIGSEEYKEVMDKLRLETLERLGYTLEEYVAAKEMVAPAKKKDVEEKLSEMESRSAETEQKISSLDNMEGAIVDQMV